MFSTLLTRNASTILPCRSYSRSVWSVGRNCHFPITEFLFLRQVAVRHHVGSFLLLDVTLRPLMSGVLVDCFWLIYLMRLIFHSSSGCLGLVTRKICNKDTNNIWKRGKNNKKIRPVFLHVSKLTTLSPAVFQFRLAGLQDYMRQQWKRLIAPQFHPSIFSY